MTTINIGRDAEFDQLTQVLSPPQWDKLEAEILSHECAEPVYTWRNSILDGQEGWELCRKHHIPFAQKQLPLKSREHAIIWICVKQGKRQDIAMEMQKYLIGRRYAAEKILAARSTVGHNQYTQTSCDRLRTVRHSGAQHRTAESIGKEYGICYATVQKYGAFALAVDKIGRISASLRAHLLSGNTKISHENVLLVASMSEVEMKQLAWRLEKNPALHLQIGDIIQVVGPRRANGTSIAEELLGPSVKNMPRYNPDTEVSGLSLTIPSWRSSISRMQGSVDAQTLARQTKENLKVELLALRDAIDCMISSIRER